MLPERTRHRGGPDTGPPHFDAPELTGGRSWLRRVLDYAVVGALVFVLALLVVVFYGTTNNRWYMVLGVQGQSMAPTINRGDLILVTRPEDPEVGDIGVFQVDGKVVTHRIMDITPEGDFLTQGDANDTPDDWSEAQVRLVGIFRGKIPWIGRFWGGSEARPGGT